jgi:hypothetical protein
VWHAVVVSDVSGTDMVIHAWMSLFECMYVRMLFRGRVLLYSLLFLALVKWFAKFNGESWTNYQCGQAIPSRKDSLLHVLLNWNRVIDSLRGGELGAMTAYLIETMTDQENDTIADDDNLTWEVAMNGPNKEGYWQACVKEIETLTRPAKMPGKLSQERNG